MIPLRLQLKNFLSYGPQEQTVNFEPYHLICLSGKNGHGKSALLDAITWAVWGQARKVSGTAKADGDLLRIGQTFMMVSFDFSFNNHTYRIKREYGKTFAKPYASLEFGILDPITLKYKSLTDKTIRTTQEKIEKTIGLDYESFINTAFLRQGHANEFSKKSPKERKDILASILSLNKYEELRKHAQDKVREASTREQQLQELQTKLTQEITEKESVAQELLSVQEKYAAVTHREQQINKQHENIAQQQAEVRTKLEALNLLQFRYSQLNQEENKEQQEVRSCIASWRGVQRQLRSLPNRTSLEQEKRHLQESLHKQQQSLHEHLQFKESYLKIKEEEQLYLGILKERHNHTVQQQKVVIERLSSQKESLITQQTHYAAYAQKAQQEIAFIEQQRVHLEKQRIEYQQSFHPTFELLFDKRKAHYHTWVSRLQQLQNEQKQLAQKQQLTISGDNPSCPLCEQNLSTSRKQFLKTKFLETERFYAHRRSRLESAAKKLKEVLIQQHAELQAMQHKQKEEQQLIVQIQELIKNSTKAEQALQEFTTKQTEITEKINETEKRILQEATLLQRLQVEVDQSINSDEQYKALEGQRTKLEEMLQKTSYNAEAHQETIKNLNQLEQKLQEYETIVQEQARQEQRKESIIAILHSLKQKKREKELVAREQTAYANITTEQEAIKAVQKQIAQEHKELQETKELLLQAKGSLEQQQTFAEQQKKEHCQQEKQLQELALTVFEYSAIASALSKNGIQALLIEDAIPEIEHEANSLLGQLTDNQTHIMIESVRDLKKGGSRETLDINISDPIGIRPYELFSGGEAFRIDFALRIAISKLLARRAGTSLQTLIIDEGFGSQDEEGLSRLMDAIYKIQDNFCKVIIVSHLSALKEQFPVHFVISKGPQGSSLQVVEQG